MKLKIIMKIIALLILVCIIGCSSGQDNEIKIGVIVHQTGVGSATGLSQLNGMVLATDDINANGGINGRTIKLIPEDNSGDNPKLAVTALNKLIEQDKVNFIIGPEWSQSAKAMIPILKKKNVVAISHSAGIADYQKSGDNVFNLKLHDKYTSEGIVEYMFDLGYKKIAILGSQQVWEKEQAEHARDKFIELGGSVVNFQLPELDNNDLRTEILKIVDAKPEAVLLTNMNNEIITVKRLAEQAPNLPKFFVIVDEGMLAAEPNGFENGIVVTDFTATDKFVQKYSERFGKEPLSYADAGYDAVMLIAKAVEATGSEDSESISSYLGSLKSYSGMSGHLEFDEFGGIRKNIEFKQVINGSLVKI